MSSVPLCDLPEPKSSEPLPARSLERVQGATVGPFMDQLREQYPQFHDGILRFVLESVDFQQDQAQEMLQGLARPSVHSRDTESSRPSSIASSITLSDNWSMVLTGSEDEAEPSSPSQLSESDPAPLAELEASPPSHIPQTDEALPFVSVSQNEMESDITVPTATAAPESDSALSSSDVNLDEAMIEMAEDGHPALLPARMAIDRLQSIFPYATTQTIVSVLEATSFNGDDAADLLLQMAPAEDASENIVIDNGISSDTSDHPAITQNNSTSLVSEPSPSGSTDTRTQSSPQDDDWSVVSDDDEMDDSMSENGNDSAGPAQGTEQQVQDTGTPHEPEGRDQEEASQQLHRILDSTTVSHPLEHLKMAFPEFSPDYLLSVLISCDCHLETAFDNLVLISDPENEPPRGRVSSEENDRDIAQNLTVGQPAVYCNPDELVEPEFDPNRFYGPDQPASAGSQPRWNSRYGWSDVGRGAPELLDLNPEEASATTRDYSATLRHPSETRRIGKPGGAWEPTSRAFGSLLSQVRPRMSFDNSDGIAGPSSGSSGPTTLPLSTPPPSYFPPPGSRLSSNPPAVPTPAPPSIAAHPWTASPSRPHLPPLNSGSWSQPNLIPTASNWRSTLPPPNERMIQNAPDTHPGGFPPQI